MPGQNRQLADNILKYVFFKENHVMLIQWFQFAINISFANALHSAGYCNLALSHRYMLCYMLHGVLVKVESALWLLMAWWQIGAKTSATIRCNHCDLWISKVPQLRVMALWDATQLHNSPRRACKVEKSLPPIRRHAILQTMHEWIHGLHYQLHYSGNDKVTQSGA